MRLISHLDFFGLRVLRALRGLLFAAALTATAGEPNVDALIADGDAAEARGDRRAALALFQQAEQLEPKNPAVLLRIARQHSEFVETEPEAAAKAAAEKSLDYSRRALALDPGNAKAHLSVAVAYGKMTDFVGNKTKLEYSKLVKEEAAKAIELDPSDDFGWHVLGRWHHGVASLNPVLRALAKVVYGGLPPASEEEAARCLRKAAEIAPQRITHHASLARVYEALGQRDLAKKEWQLVLSLPAAGGDDHKAKREAAKAVKAR